MAVNPNDARFFLTLCNFLKKHEISFEVIETPEIEHNGQLYEVSKEQFGVVDHSKDNLMKAFDQIVELFNKGFEKLFLYRFYFDVYDEATNLGQYTLQYICVEKVEAVTEEVIAEPDSTIEEEPVEPIIEEEITVEPDQEEITIIPEEIEDNPILVEEEITEEISEDIIEPIRESETSEILEVEIPDQASEESVLSEENQIADQAILSSEENSFIQNTLLTENQEIKRDEEMENNTKKDDIFVKSPNNYDLKFYNNLQTDIEYLIKLLDKNINPEVSEVLSKAIMIVIKNRLEME